MAQPSLRAAEARFVPEAIRRTRQTCRARLRHEETVHGHDVRSIPPRAWASDERDAINEPSTCATPVDGLLPHADEAGGGADTVEPLGRHGRRPPVIPVGQSVSA